jgi:site-specific recombinase XerD
MSQKLVTTKYYGRAPDTLSAQEVQAYLAALVKERGLAWSTLSVTVHGLRFCYEVTLGRPRTRFSIPTVKTPATQPEILSRQEVARLLQAVTNRKHRALLMTTYAAGLRVREVVRLKVADLDSERMAMRVAQGKGRKDRDTLLSERLLEELRGYWRVYRPPRWLFPGRGGQHPLARSTAPCIYQVAKDRAGIHKTGGIHSLRHAFATHLLEAGGLTCQPSNPCWATIVSARRAAISISCMAEEPTSGAHSISWRLSCLLPPSAPWRRWQARG